MPVRSRCAPGFYEPAQRNLELGAVNEVQELILGNRKNFHIVSAITLAVRLTLVINELSPKYS